MTCRHPVKMLEAVPLYSGKCPFVELAGENFKSLAIGGKEFVKHGKICELLIKQLERWCQVGFERVFREFRHG